MRTKKILSQLLTFAMILNLLLIPVFAESGGGTITSFGGLPDNIRYQCTSSPVLPATIGGAVDGKPVQIPVNWKAEGYTPESALPGLYVFFAEPGRDFVLDNDVEAPTITVILLQPKQSHTVGIGSSETNPIIITNADQLSEIATLTNSGRLEIFITGNAAAEVYFKLGNDIDLSSYGASRNGGAGWIPIGHDSSNGFKGHFDGGGYNISNLYINDTGYSNTGLFGLINGSVKNLGLVNVSVKGGDFTGGLAGSAGGNVTNCYVTGSVSGKNMTGGMAGSISYHGSVINCYATAAVSGQNGVGGVVGNAAGNVTNCAALNSNVSGTGDAGRVAGSDNGTLSGNIAFAHMGTGRGIDFALDGITDTLTGIDGEGMAAEEIIADGTIRGVFANDSNPWTCEDGKLPGLNGQAAPAPLHFSLNPYSGSGSDTDFYIIETAEQLAWLAEAVNVNKTDPNGGYFSEKHYRLSGNINLSAFGADWNGGTGWVPIGCGNNLFRGQFDGGGHTISNLYINDTVSPYDSTGLFGGIDGGSVSNLKLTNVKVKGGSYTGGVAGRINNGSLTRCVVTGEIGGTGSNVGGVAGGVAGGNVTNCYSTSAVSSTGDNAGGVAGSVTDSNVTNCYSTGAVSGNSNVGGVAGLLNAGSVKNCAALNPSVSGAANVSRVAGRNNAGVLSSNAAFDKILNSAGTTNWGNKGADNIDGVDMSYNTLKNDGTIGGRFANNSNPWLSKSGYLPGLFSYAVPIPEHISGNLFKGSGTSSDPYIITTPGELNNVRSRLSSHYKLGNDIDLTDYLSADPSLDYPSGGPGYDGGKGWDPIGVPSHEFTGKFNGSGYTISGLWINRSTDNVGLFGSVHESLITNLSVEINDTLGVKGNNNVGGIAGELSRTNSITNCRTAGRVTGNDNVGGVVGNVYLNSTVINCYSTAAVNGNDNVGGVAGYVVHDFGYKNSYMRSCYSTGAVSGNNNVGGVAGLIGDDVKIIGCAALNPEVIGLGIGAGRVTGKEIGTVSNSLAFEGMLNKEGKTEWTHKDKSKIDGEDISAANVIADGTLKGLFVNNSSPWTTENGKLPGLFGKTGSISTHFLLDEHPFDGGDGLDTNPYIITAAEQLEWLADAVNSGKDDPNGGEFAEKCYVLGADIDLSGYGAGWNGGAGWIPIGHADSYSFRGCFDGGGYNISNLYINSDGYGNIGLFGRISGGSVTALGLVNADIKGGSFTGGLAGYVNGSIENCYVSGSVTGSNSVGGLAGYVNGGSVTNCCAAASVSGNGNAGGLAGVISGSSRVENSCATGMVSGDNNVGGLAGAISDGSSMEKCYATGAVSGNDNVGGAAGIVSDGGSMEKCYAVGVVNGNDNAGGLAGIVSGGSVSNCYAIGTVSGNENVGGAAGVASSGGSVENCYAAGAVSGTNYVGGVAGYVNGSVSNCVALNSDVSGTGDVGRVAGFDSGSALSGNAAFDNMNTNGGTAFILDGTTNTPAGIDGAGIGKDDVIDESFWTDTMGWDTALVWLYRPLKLPILDDLEGQNGDLGLYLTQKDLHYTSFDPVPAIYEFTGDPIYPIVVWGDGTVLVMDVDYTLTVTSADGSGSSGGTNVGIVTVTVTGIGDYRGEMTDAAYTIAAKSIVFNGAVNAEKMYDGTEDFDETHITITDAGNFTGIVGTDDVLFTVLTGAVGSFGPDAGNGTLTLAGTPFALTGADADSYVLSAQPAVTAGITAKPVTFTGTAAAEKVYDGTDVFGDTHITITGESSFDGVVGLDIVILTTVPGEAGTFGPNVGSGMLTLTGTPFMLAGTDAGNYVLSAQPAAVAASITPVQIAFAGTVTAEKVYDGTDVFDDTHITITGAGDFTGIAGTDDVALAVLTGVVGSFGPNTGNGTLTLTGTPFMLTGADAGNYALPAQPAVTAGITVKPVTFTGAAAAEKVYDGTDVFDDTHITITGESSFDGIVGLDIVILTTVSGETGTFGPNVGSGTLTLTGTPFMLAGADAGNYVLSAQPAAVAASITPAQIAFTGTVTAEKVYDGTDVFDDTHITITDAGDFTGIAGTDDVTLAVLTGVVGNFGPNTGNGTLTLTGTPFMLTGADAGNYALPAQPAVTAGITAKPVTFTGTAAAEKVYDGTGVFDDTHITITGESSFDGIVGLDIVILTAVPGETGTFGPNVGSGMLTLTGTPFTLAGADAGNYVLSAQPAAVAASITPVQIAFTGTVTAEKVYDGTDIFDDTHITITDAGDFTGIVGTDDVTLAVLTGVVGSFGPNTGNGTLTLTGTPFTLTGADAGNYALPAQPAVTAGITVKPVTFTGAAAAEKVYDGTDVFDDTHITITGESSFDGVVGLDIVILTAVPGETGTFGPNVGSGTLTLTGTPFTLAGADAGNYVLSAQPAAVAASITPAQIAFTGTVTAEKVYDGTDVFDDTHITITDAGDFTGIVGTDDVTLAVLTGVVGSFGPNTGNGTLTLTGTPFTLTGADAGNYALPAQPAVTAGITAKPVTFTGTATAEKVYDGTDVFDDTHITITGESIFDGVVGLDIVILTAVPGETGTFGPNVGSGTLTLTGTPFTLAGADAGNYVLSAQPAAVAASITPVQIAFTGTVTAEKVYDGTDIFDDTHITITDAGDFTGVAGTDDVALDMAGVTGTFGPNVGNGTLALAGASFALTGADAGNYILSAQPEVAAIITPATMAFPLHNIVSETYVPTLTLGDIALDPGYVWDDDTTLLTMADNGASFPATYTDPSGNYYPVSGMIEVMVNRGTMSFPEHPAVSGIYTNMLTLADLAPQLQTGYVWDDDTPALAVADSGTSFPAVYTDPAGNYEPVDGTIMVNVEKAPGADVNEEPTVSGNPTQESITVNDVTHSGDPEQAVEYAISMSVGEDPANLTWQSDTTFSGLKEKTVYYVYARTAESDNYYAGTARINLEEIKTGSSSSSSSSSSRPQATIQDPETVPPEDGFFTVTFDTNGGDQKNAQYVESGKTIASPADPVKDGFIFAGWYADASLTAEYDFNKPITDDIVLYAKWTAENPLEVENDQFFYPVKFVYSNGLKAITGTAMIKYAAANGIEKGYYKNDIMSGYYNNGIGGGYGKFGLGNNIMWLDLAYSLIRSDFM